MTGTKRAKRFRERLRTEAIPTPVQFDREIRLVVIQHIFDETMALAKAVSLTRERLRKKLVRPYQLCTVI